MMYLPEPVYRYLPTINAVAGGILAAIFDVGIGKVAGIALVVAGVLALNARINARSN